LTLVVLAPLGAACNLQTDWGDDPAGGTYTATRHPIVLLPGFLGFESLLGGAVDYWVNIPEALGSGGAVVFTVESSLVNTPEARGEMIIPQLEEILAITGAKRLNLIGHSQGTLDARYIAGVRPELVASVTSIGGPHGGTPLADLAQIPGLAELGAIPIELLAKLMVLVGGPDGPRDPAAAFLAMSTEATATFNALYPGGVPEEACGEGDPVADGIHYFSWMGTAHCTNARDVLDPLWALTGLFIPEENDGLVGRCSSHLGQVIRDDYFMNHLDEVNLMFGLVSETEVKPELVFRAHANRLAGLGL